MDREEEAPHSPRLRQPFRPLRRLEGAAAPALAAIRKPPALASSEDFGWLGWLELALDEEVSGSPLFKLS